MRAIVTPAQIGTLLAGRRKHLNLTQAELASRVGLSQNRLSVLEKDSSSMTAAQLLALLGALGLEMTLGDRAGAKSKAEW
jgi:HTH-type transcriptional regulator/antitoxin HipB